MADVRAFCSDALKVLGVLAPGQTMPDEHAEDALVQFTRMCKAFNAKRLTIGSYTRTTYAWPSATSSRTIGATGQLVGTRPLWLNNASVIPNGQTNEVPLGRPMTRQEYADITDKAATAGWFSRYLFEPAAPDALITVYPVPTAAVTLVLYPPVPLESSVTLDTTVTVLDAWEEHLQYQLAKRLAVIFKQPWTALLESLAHDAKTRAEIANVRVEPQRNDRSLVGRGSFDIESGQFR